MLVTNRKTRKNDCNDFRHTNKINWMSEVISFVGRN